jgi:MinD-like ATPase involved in chromosome partitioning or flagellar assembly
MALLERPRLFSQRTGALHSPELGELVLLGQSRWRPSLVARKGMLVLVVHGPRGAGASTVAANLAIALTQFGTRVVLLDLDMKRPTQHKLFGIEAPVSGLRALLAGSVETMGDALTATGLKNLFLVTSNDLADATRVWDANLQRHVLAQLAELNTDILIVDSGDDGTPALGFFGQDEVGHLFVSPPGVETITRIESFIVEHVRALLAGEGAFTESAARSPTEVASVLRAAPAAVRDRVSRRLATFAFGLIGNRMREDRQVGLVHAASRWFAHQWGVRVPVLGVLTEATRHVGTAGQDERPFLLSARWDRNSRAVHLMAEILLAEAASAAVIPHDIVASLDVSGPLATGPSSLPAPACFPRQVASSAELAEETWRALEPFMRRSPRFEVDWYGTLRLPCEERAMAVRIFEVSEIGAAIETVVPMTEGERGELRLDQVRGAPTLSVRVQRLHPGLNRAGVSFEGTSPEVRHALVAIARAHQP